MALLRSVLGRRGFFICKGYYMKYATIKERRAAADLLAIKAGRAARGPEDIEKASLLSDQEVWDLLKENTPQAVEVEEIKPGADPDGLPADLFGYCDNLINDFCQKFNIDKYNMSPLQWGAACSYVGRGFSSRSAFRVPSDNFIKGSNKKIDAQAVAGLVPIWADMCGVLNKVPLAHDFANFCGLSWDWLYKLEYNGENVTPADINLYKRVRAICRGGLDSRLIDGKAAPVGAIFYAKAKEGYQETQTITHVYENKGGSVAALPDFGNYAALTDENGEK